jgi:HSP20 family protein
MENGLLTVDLVREVPEAMNRGKSRSPTAVSLSRSPSDLKVVEMTLGDLIPWNRGRALASRSGEETNPFVALHWEMNRLFDSFARGFDPTALAWPGGWPHVAVSDSGDEVRVTAELPGMEQKDVEVSLQEGVLIIRGEKKAESEGALYSERWHGQFQRSLQLGPDIDPDKINASFKNGVLTVTACKRPEAQRRVKRIPIN